MAENKRKAGRPEKIRTIRADADTICRHADDISDAYKAMKERQIEHADLFKDAEKDGVHRGALALGLRLGRMSDAKRADFIRGLNDTLEALDLNRQADLFEQQQASVHEFESAA